jgi:L-asparaginase
VIALIFTGGTISMRLDPATGAAVPALGADEIVAQVPGLDAIAEVEIDDFARWPGPHVTPDHMWQLARRASAWLERPDIDGLVITHGTDTIEETAYLLDLLLLTDKPVVLVGAMRTVSDPSWDGPANLLAAARVAACPDARGLGVLVVMDDRILPAREVRKVHTESSTAFATPEFGPLGVVDAGRVLLRRSLPRHPQWRDAGADAGLRVARIDTRVELVQAYTGMSDRVVRLLTSEGQRGLAVIGFGRGNVPPAIVPAIADAVRAGVLVTISSRSAAGRVSPRYGYEGGGRHLLDQGAVLAGHLPGAKARLLLMVILGFTNDTTIARALLAQTVTDASLALND